MKNGLIGFLFFLAGGMLLITSCDDDDNGNNCASTTGPVVTETRTLSEFNSISFEGVGNILLTQGSPQSVLIETHQDILEIIETEVKNEELKIEMRRCIDGTADKIDFHITIPEIKTLNLDGVGNIIAQNNLNLDDLDIDLMGVGNIILKGATDNLNVNSSGVGNILAFDLVAKSCEVRLTGVGNVQVNVTDELDVTISGSGNVSYRGNPTISADITGAGSLNDAN